MKITIELDGWPADAPPSVALTVTPAVLVPAMTRADVEKVVSRLEATHQALSGIAAGPPPRGEPTPGKGE